MIINNKLFTGNIEKYSNKVEITGKLKPNISHFTNDNIMYWGAKSSTNNEPWQNHILAFHDSDNIGLTKLNDNNEFYVVVTNPNEYYYNGDLIDSCLNFKMLNGNDDEIVTVFLNDNNYYYNPCADKLCGPECPYCESAPEHLYKSSGHEYKTPLSVLSSNINDPFVYLHNFDGFRDGPTLPNLTKIVSMREDELPNVNRGTIPSSVTESALSNNNIKRLLASQANNRELNNIERGTLPSRITETSLSEAEIAKLLKDQEGELDLNQVKADMLDMAGDCGISEIHWTDCINNLFKTNNPNIPEPYDEIACGHCLYACRCDNSNRYNEDCRKCWNDYESSHRSTHNEGKEHPHHKHHDNIV